MVLSVGYIKEKWQHAGFQKYLRNTGWMFLTRITAFATSFFTVSIVARYLGPENLGKLDYAQSFIAVISVFASLGIDQVLFRDLVRHPERKNALLGTAIITKLIFGSTAFVVSILSSFLIGNDLILTILIGICASTFIISPVGTISILFSSQVKSKYTSIISIFLSFFIPLLKILIIFLGKGLIFFALTILIESLVTALWSIFIYTRHLRNNLTSLYFNLATFKQLVTDSWPLLLSNLSGYIYDKADQILLLHYLNSFAVGIYSAAVKLTQIWAFLPSMIIGSLFPAIINAKKVSIHLYHFRLKLLLLSSLGSITIIVIPLYVYSDQIINAVFGQTYTASVPILKIYLWASIAITFVTFVQQYLIAENMGKVFLYISLMGAISNLALNIVLIPAYGPTGSAWGTLISYFIIITCVFVFKKTRRALIDIISIEVFPAKN